MGTGLVKEHCQAKQHLRPQLGGDGHIEGFFTQCRGLFPIRLGRGHLPRGRGGDRLLREFQQLVDQRVAALRRKRAGRRLRVDRLGLRVFLLFREGGPGQKARFEGPWRIGRNRCRRGDRLILLAGQVEAQRLEIGGVARGCGIRRQAAKGAGRCGEVARLQQGQRIIERSGKQRADQRQQGQDDGVFHDWLEK